MSDAVEIVRRQLVDAEPLDDIPARDHVILRSDRPVEAISPTSPTQSMRVPRRT